MDFPTKSKLELDQEWSEYWQERVNTTRNGRILFGFKLKEGDPTSLVPDVEVVTALEQALDNIDNGASIRSMVQFLTEQTSKEISHVTLSQIWRRFRGHSENPIAQKNNQLRDKQSGEGRDEQKRRRVNQKIATQRRRATLAKKAEQRLLERQRTLAALKEETEETKKRIKDIVPTYVVMEDIPEAVQEEEIIFRPHDGPQTDFLAASEQEVLYGGAAGGGKSYGLLADPMRYFDNPNFNGLILRRTNDELRELIWKSQMLYPRAFPGAKWSSKQSTWTFPAGGHLWFTYLERDEDVLRYQGQSFCYIGFDELTQHPTAFPWNYMRSRLRVDADSGLPKMMRATTNPGGPGHGWVKQMFIDPAPYGQAFGARDDNGETLLVPDGDPDFPPERWNKPVFMRRFIPALLSDNPSLAKGGDYKANLLSMPEQQRRQLLDGDWTVADGAAFQEFRHKIHVVKPRDIPHDWKRFRSCDYGYSSHSAVHWFAIEPQTEILILYRELYTTKMTARDLGKKILELEAGENIQYGVLDSSCWHVRGINGPTIEEEMRQTGCRWRPSDRSAQSRGAGKNRIHELLKVFEDDKNSPAYGRPGLEIFDTCRQIIADLPVIPSHPDGKEDIDDRYRSDHAYDSLRYAVMSRPKSVSPFGEFTPRDKPSPKYRPLDPLFGY